MLVTNTFASYTVAPAKNEPQKLRWKDNTIRIAISNSLSEGSSSIKNGSDVQGAILRSLKAWENAAGLQFVLEQSDRLNVSPSGIAGDGVSLITIAGSPENVSLFAKNPLTESARTRVFYNRVGNITEADIVLNPYQLFSTDGTLGTFDLESTLTHEIGHLLGLRHSSVIGSVMSEGVARNGAGGSTELSTAQLTEADLSAIRDLYGFDGGSAECCSAISGRLTQAASKFSASVRVWAEDSKTGRVAAQTESGTDGSFRLGGLNAGSYSVFWQRVAGTESSPIGELGTVRLAAGDERVFAEKINLRRSDLVLNYLGTNDQLSESPVTVGSLREFTVYLGGKDIDTGKISIEFNSPYFRAVPGSIKAYDYGQGLSAISFVLSVEGDVQPGVYSVFVTGSDGILGALVGGLKVNSRSSIQ